MRNPTQRKKTRIDVLDAFRGIAIISVLIFHYLVRWAPPFSTIDLYGYGQRYSPSFEVGAYGVHVFFVISGFVIAMTLADCRSAFEFAVKRFARLYPAYVVAATITFILMWGFGPQVLRVTSSDYFVNLTMLSADLHHRYVDGAYWSLAVEIKFYFLAAIGFALLRGNFWMFIVAVAIASTVLARINPGLAEMLFFVRFMPLFVVGIAAWLLLLANRRREGIVTMAVGVALYANNAHSFVATLTPSWAVHMLIVGLSISMILLLWRAPASRLGPLAFIGRISYSLYLVHQNIGISIIRALTEHGTPDLLAVACAVGISGAIAWTIFVFVEQRGRKLIMAGYHTLLLTKSINVRS